MDMTSRLLGAALLTYFVSRVTIRLPNPLRKNAAISLAHGLSLALIAVGLYVWPPSGSGSLDEEILPYVAMQIAWWLLDMLRARKAGARFMGRALRQGPA